MKTWIMIALSGLIVALVIMPSICVSAQLDINWSRTFGGPRSDIAESATATNDGGYILTGMTLSYGAGQGDLWLVKVDSKGTEQWNKTFGGSKIDIGRSVIQARDGGYVVVGSTKSYGVGNSDAWMIKTDKNGTELWNKTFGSRSADEAASVQQTKDGGYILAGYTSRRGNDDLWLIKTDGNGTEQWNRTIGGPGNDEGNSVIQTSDEGYVVAGKTNSYGSGSSSDDGNSDAWLVKTDFSGKEQWNITLGGSKIDEARSVIQARDGGHVLTGYTNAQPLEDNPVSDVLVAKVRQNGSIEWQKSFGGKAQDEGQGILQTEDNGYLVAGSTSKGESSGGALVAKISPTGKVEWTKTYGEPGIHSVTSLISSGDSYAVSGSANRSGSYDLDFWLLKLR